MTRPARLGDGLTIATRLLDAECGTTFTAGGRLDLARRVTLAVLTTAADRHPDMPVRELLMRLETGGAS